MHVRLLVWKAPELEKACQNTLMECGSVKHTELVPCQ